MTVVVLLNLRIEACVGYGIVRTRGSGRVLFVLSLDLSVNDVCMFYCRIVGVCVLDS